MSKRAEKRARFAAANARLDRHAYNPIVTRSHRACAVDAALTLKGNFIKDRARQAHEQDQRDALECSRVVEIKYPAPGDHVAHAQYVALVETKFGVSHDHA